MKTKKNIDEYTFLDHLEELRWRIIKTFIGFGIILIISLFFVPTILAIIMNPIKGIDTGLNVFSFQGYFFAYLKVGLITAIIFTFPIAIYQLSAFILPGLFPEEKKWFFITVIVSVIFFVGGIIFSYIVLTPISFNFLYRFASESKGFNLFLDAKVTEITILPGLNQYVDLFLILIFITGVAFQLPLVIVFLTKIRVVDDRTLSKLRPYFLIIILIVSAFITPPDIITQIILGIPMYLLFEISIILSRIIRKLEEKKERKNYVK